MFAKRQDYKPNIGYIGNKKVRVKNYLYSTKGLQIIPHPYAKSIGELILKIPVAAHFERSQKLTRFMQKRGLTFSRKSKAGNYQSFSVPVANTPVPLAKSAFNQIEKEAQILIFSLRKILQDIYSAPNLEEARFVRFLPEAERGLFLKSILSSPAYFKQLHHQNMANYPFFDVVGLDLVLVEEDAKGSEFSFKLLEINAGSPSGASNNYHILEGIAQCNPEILAGFDKVLPNDHFTKLKSTYAELGFSWTGIKNAISVIIPPGGASGATPEIHQLAAYSSIVYADPNQLYADENGYIRLQTINGKDPVVSSIYSRVNADAILYDPANQIYMRDPENNEPLYIEDLLINTKNGEKHYSLDELGNKIYLESNYVVKGIREAIIDRKIYLGGLNRVLDNKIILPILSKYAVKFCAKELIAAGFDLEKTKVIATPESLPSNSNSVDIIATNPNEWVIKEGNLSGGNGIYILQTLSSTQINKAIALARKNPEHFAYQRLVKIARLPVAIKDKKNKACRFANLAADIRMWMFYGDKDLPRLTHNGLVRVAKEEIGPFSSIVNTSQGGGYAPLIIVDDISSQSAISMQDLLVKKTPADFGISIPIAVAPQLVQIKKFIDKISLYLLEQNCSYTYVCHLVESLRLQVREVLSFLSPQNMEPLNEMQELLSKIGQDYHIFKKLTALETKKIRTLELLTIFNSVLPKEVYELFENLSIFNSDYLFFDKTISLEEQNVFERLIDLLLRVLASNRTINLMQFEELIGNIRYFSLFHLRHQTLKKSQIIVLNAHLEIFKILLKDRFTGYRNKEYLQIMSTDIYAKYANFNGMSSVCSSETVPIASLFEKQTNTLLANSSLVSAELKEIKRNWNAITLEAQEILSAQSKEQFVFEMRRKHFNKYPVLQRYQNIINSQIQNMEELIELLDVLPYAKFNLEYFAKSKGLELKNVFANTLQPNRVSFLSPAERKRLGVYCPSVQGECFALKRKTHAYLSSSDINIWVGAEFNPLIKLFTAGHELIHYYQIQEICEMEQKALAEGTVSFAQFLNYYATYLSISTNIATNSEQLGKVPRQTFYGLIDLKKYASQLDYVKNIFTSAKIGAESFNGFIKGIGSSLNCCIPQNPATQIKALREVIPAIENAKNISFAKSLGLIVDVNEISSALPIANNFQLSRFASKINRIVQSPIPMLEDMRVVANNQLYGVYFPCVDDWYQINNVLTTIYIGNSYNNMHQQ